MADETMAALKHETERAKARWQAARRAAYAADGLMYAPEFNTVSQAEREKIVADGNKAHERRMRAFARYREACAARSEYERLIEGGER